MLCNTPVVSINVLLHLNAVHFSDVWSNSVLFYYSWIFNDYSEMTSDETFGRTNIDYLFLPWSHLQEIKVPWNNGWVFASNFSHHYCDDKHTETPSLTRSVPKCHYTLSSLIRYSDLFINAMYTSAPKYRTAMKLMKQKMMGSSSNF